MHIPPLQDILSLSVDDEEYSKLEPKQKREKIFEAIRDVLVKESEVKHLIITIEDLHWMDKTSEELYQEDYSKGLLGALLLRFYLYLHEPGIEIEPWTNAPEHVPGGPLCMAYLGRDTEVNEVLEQYITNPKFSDENYQFSLWHDTLLLEAALKVKHHRAAEFFVHRFQNSNIKSLGLWTTTYIKRHTGAAWEFLGNPEEAMTHYLEALEYAGKDECRPEIAFTRFQLAKLLFNKYPENREEASKHLDFAILEFHEMKMKPLIREAESFMKGLGDHACRS